MRKLKPSFDDYELEPSPQVWMKIASRLDDVPRKRRGWLFFGLAAALIAGFVLFITLFYDVEINVKQKQHASDVSAVNAVKEPVSGNGHVPLNTATTTSSSSAQRELASSDAHSTFALRESVKIKPAGNSGLNVLAGPKSVRRNSSSQSLFVASSKNTKNMLTGVGLETEPDPAEARMVAEKVNLIDPFSISAEPVLQSSLSFTHPSGETASKKTSLSRWMISLGAAYEYDYRIINYAYGSSLTIENKKNYFENEKGIHSLSLSALMSCNLSTHFSLASGINYFSAGQERSESEVKLNSVTPSNTVYSVQTSTGSVNGSGTQFNNTYYTNSDSALFHVAVLNVSPTNTSFAVVRNFTFRQQFYFISIPVLLQYQLSEHRFTPYVGVGFSAGYLVKEKVLMNNQVLDYSNSEKLNSVLFSAESLAGIKYNACGHYSVSLQPYLRYGFNSINSNSQVKWIPYAWGIGAKMNYRF